MNRKRLLAALITVVILFVAVTPALAANKVGEIAVDVTLRPDGSAYVVQTWNGNFNEGTECYFPITNLGGINISDLSVADEQGAFTTIQNWNPDATFEEKARKCGLNPIDGGYEVCWGISHYGANRYAVEYELQGLVAAYNDSDGFLFQFVPSGMNSGPTDVTVRITLQNSTAITEDNSKIWAFGFNGQIGFEKSGSALAYTEEPLTSDSSVIVMLQLNKGVLSPVRTVPGTFEEVKTRAFEGSDYGENSSSGIWVFAVITGISCMVTLAWWLSGAEKRKVKKLCKSADYCREAPIGGNLEASFVLARQFGQSDDDGNIIAAILTKLLAEGCLEPITERDVGFMGREKKSISLRLVSAPKFRSSVAAKLYALLTATAGGDGILQERELEAYCRTNYQALLQIVQEAQRDGSGTLTGIGCYNSPLETEKLSDLSTRGNALLLQIIGYKKYLLEFSLIAERGVNEAMIWQDCLCYAAMLGIGEQVMKELKKLYPGVNAQIQAAETSYYVAYRYNLVTYHAAKTAEAQAIKRASGGGGRSSFGGGGGFSGGGSGGGTR